MSTVVFTVGHSNVRLATFVSLLKENSIAALADVRSVPASGYSPQFSQNPLRGAVEAANLSYVFMGRELGGRPRGHEFYDAAGYVLYYRLANSPVFRNGLERLCEIADGERTAIMCSEEDPAKCHRHLLIARVLSELGVDAVHLRHDGASQPYATMTDVRHRRLQQESLFAEAEDTAWKSTRSVSLRDQPRASSTH